MRALSTFLSCRPSSYEGLFFLFSVSFFFHSLPVLSAFVDIIGVKVLCITACFLRSSNRIKTKRKWKALVPPLRKVEGTTDGETDLSRKYWLIINYKADIRFYFMQGDGATPE